MPWYRVKGFLEIDGARYAPGDWIFLSEDRAQRTGLGRFLLSEEGREDERKPDLPSGGQVVKLKKLDPWWRRLFS